MYEIKGKYTSAKIFTESEDTDVVRNQRKIYISKNFYRK